VWAWRDGRKGDDDGEAFALPQDQVAAQDDEVALLEGRLLEAVNALAWARAVGGSTTALGVFVDTDTHHGAPGGGEHQCHARTGRRAARWKQGNEHAPPAKSIPRKRRPW
jgi:hypothetical protein